jgi:hypothetical protein
MRAVETRRRNEEQQGTPGKTGPAIFAFYSPRPPLLRGSTKESMRSKLKPSQKPKPSEGDRVTTLRGSVADAFFGASPVVASALGIRLGATPRGRHQRTTASPGPGSEWDISTLLGIGHFYFALTGDRGFLNRAMKLNVPASTTAALCGKSRSKSPIVRVPIRNIGQPGEAHLQHHDFGSSFGSIAYSFTNTVVTRFPSARAELERCSA